MEWLTCLTTNIKAHLLLHTDEFETLAVVVGVGFWFPRLPPGVPFGPLWRSVFIMRRVLLVCVPVCVAVLLLFGCTPEEVAVFKVLDPEGQAAVTAHLQAQAQPVHVPPGGFLACVRRHESGGDYRAENPVSTASGAYQFLDSTWRTMSGRAGHPGWGHAASAPPWVQDAVAVFTVESGWASAWDGTGC
jgi:hypothetical protein